MAHTETASPAATSQAASPASKGESTRRAILEAAIERFGRDGYRSTSVADIARDASVSGTAAYAYFPNKEALFLAAIDSDAAGVIHEGLSSLSEGTVVEDWRRMLIFTLVDAVQRHPLAKRLLAGLEPEVTERVLGIPALEDLRAVCVERISSEQAAGRVRADIDPTVIGNGVVSIMLSLLMSVVQVGPGAAVAYGDGVAAVFAAALDVAPPSRRR